MVQLIVVIASVLLGMFLYPILLRKWKRFVEWLYWCTNGETDEEAKEKKPQKTEPKEMGIPSVIGKSKFNLRQSTPNTATDLKSENPIEKESTFAPEPDSDPEKFDVDIPLEKDQPVMPDEAAEEEEPLDAGHDAVLASGASYDELMHTNRTVAGEQVSEADKGEAGRVLYENRRTDMFEQVAANSEETARTIATLIDIHLAMRTQRLQGANEMIYPDEFKDFDIDSIF
jgi:hypothetical protein